MNKKYNKYFDSNKIIILLSFSIPHDYLKSRRQMDIIDKKKVINVT